MAVVSVSLPDDLVARMDEAAGPRGRSRFICGALESALGINNSGPINKPRPKRKPADGHPDDPLVVEWMRGRKGASERLLREGLGWTEMRASKAVSRMLAAGLLEVSGPGYFALAEGV